MIRYLFFFIFLILKVSAQEISIEQCYKLTLDNYPIAKQKEIIEQSGQALIKSINTAFLPQLDLNGQATYQSEVLSIPIKLPGMKISEIDKDQYKATLDVKQMVYDGGLTNAQKEYQNNSSQLEQQKIEVELFKIKDRVNQLYFSILLSDENLDLMNNFKSEIKNKLNKITASVQNGISLPLNADMLKAELIKTEQKIIEIKYSKSASIRMLSLLSGGNVNEKNTFLIPTLISFEENNQIKRPETKLFSLQEKQFDAQSKISLFKTRPKFNFFLQAGYGKPAFNMFDNSFSPFYIGGLKFSWNIWNWKSTSFERQSIELNKTLIAKQRETFELNTQISLSQQASEISKYKALINKDQELINIRQKIKNTISLQLENGTATSSDYITELNNENQARLGLKMHELQMLLGIISYRTTQGD